MDFIKSVSSPTVETFSKHDDEIRNHNQTQARRFPISLPHMSLPCGCSPSRKQPMGMVASGEMVNVGTRVLASGISYLGRIRSRGSLVMFPFHCRMSSASRMLVRAERGTSFS